MHQTLWNRGHPILLRLEAPWVHIIPDSENPWAYSSLFVLLYFETKVTVTDESYQRTTVVLLSGGTEKMSKWWVVTLTCHVQEGWSYEVSRNRQGCWDNKEQGMNQMGSEDSGMKSENEGTGHSGSSRLLYKEPAWPCHKEQLAPDQGGRGGCLGRQCVAFRLWRRKNFKILGGWTTWWPLMFLSTYEVLRRV